MKHLSRPGRGMAGPVSALPSCSPRWVQTLDPSKQNLPYGRQSFRRLKESHPKCLRDARGRTRFPLSPYGFSPSRPTTTAEAYSRGHPAGLSAGRTGAAGAPARAGRGGERWPGAGRPLLAAQRHSGPDRAPQGSPAQAHVPPHSPPPLGAPPGAPGQDTTAKPEELSPLPRCSSAWRKPVSNTHVHTFIGI